MTCCLNERRLLPVSEFSSCPENDWLDRMVQIKPHRKAEVWVRTRAAAPKLVIRGLKDGAKHIVELTPQECVEGSARYVLMGSTDTMAGGTYYELLLFGMTPETQVDSLVIISLDAVLDKRSLAECGTDSELEKVLWGVARKQVGVSTMTPDELEVGTAGDFKISFSPGIALGKGDLIRIVYNWTFICKDNYTFDITAGGAKVGMAGKERVGNTKMASTLTVTERIGPDETLMFRLRTPHSLAFPALLADREFTHWYSALPVLIFELSVDGGKNFVSPSRDNSHTVEFVPGTAAALHLFLPGRRRVGGKNVMHGIVTDRYRNLTPVGAHRFDDAELSLVDMSGARRPLGRLADFKTDTTHFRTELPELGQGVYRLVAVDPVTGDEISRSNPLQIVDRGVPSEVYWGGIHAHTGGVRAHTGMSDGFGTMAESYRYARDDAALDVACVAEHGAYFTLNQWEDIQDLVDNFYGPSDFATLIGYEWNASERNRETGAAFCYHIVIYAADRINRYNGLTDMTEALDELSRRDDVVCETHHAGRGPMTVWKFRHVPDLLQLFEVYSCFGVYERGGAGRAESAVELLRSGAKVGLIGGGDSHAGYCAFGPKAPPEDFGRVTCIAPANFHPYQTGVTAFVAAKLERADIIDAMRRRRVYATTGARILIDFHVSGLDMGEEGPVDDVVASGEVHACDDVVRAEIKRDGERVYEIEPGRPDFIFEWRDAEVPTGEHFYYLHLEQADGERAWSSPVWVVRR